jgi:hypothetical protein
MLCPACRQREVEIREHTKLPLQPNLCGPCYRRECYEYKQREKLARSLPKLFGKTFRDYMGREPGDPSFWLKPSS